MFAPLILAIIFFLPLPVMRVYGRNIKDGYKTIFIGVGLVAAGITAVFILARFMGSPIGASIAENLGEVTAVASENPTVVDMMGLGKVAPQERVKVLTEAYTYAFNALPALMLILATLVSYMEYRILVRFTAGGSEPLTALTPIKDFSLPKRAFWGWIIIYAVTAMSVILGVYGSDVLQANVQLLFQFVFQIQGVAVIFFFCSYKKWSSKIGLILSIIFFLTSIGQMLLCLLGFLDLGFGLRKPGWRRRK